MVDDRPSFLDAAFDEAKLASCRSRDPSTKVGCAIFRADKTLVSKGYNGFPRGVDDTPSRYEDRETKLRMIVHAELNAILTAKQNLTGTHLFSTLFPCASCAGAIIQAGIATVSAPRWTDDQYERWGQDIEISRTMLHEGGVGVFIYSVGSDGRLATYPAGP